MQAIVHCCQIIHHVHLWGKVIQQQTPTWDRHYTCNIRGWHPTRLTVQPFSFFNLFSPSLSIYISIWICCFQFCTDTFANINYMTWKQWLYLLHVTAYKTSLSLTFSLLKQLILDHTRQNGYQTVPFSVYIHNLMFVFILEWVPWKESGYGCDFTTYTYRFLITNNFIAETANTWPN